MSTLTLKTGRRANPQFSMGRLRRAAAYRPNRKQARLAHQLIDGEASYGRPYRITHRKSKPKGFFV